MDTCVPAFSLCLTCNISDLSISFPAAPFPARRSRSFFSRPLCCDFTNRRRAAASSSRPNSPPCAWPASGARSALPVMTGAPPSRPWTIAFCSTPRPMCPPSCAPSRPRRRRSCLRLLVRRSFLLKNAIHSTHACAHPGMPSFARALCGYQTSASTPALSTIFSLPCLSMSRGLLNLPLLLSPPPPSAPPPNSSSLASALRLRARLSAWTASVTSSHLLLLRSAAPLPRPFSPLLPRPPPQPSTRLLLPPRRQRLLLSPASPRLFAWLLPSTASARTLQSLSACACVAFVPWPSAGHPHHNPPSHSHHKSPSMAC